jgi:hypothetical protein
MTRSRALEFQISSVCAVGPTSRPSAATFLCGRRDGYARSARSVARPCQEWPRGSNLPRPWAPGFVSMRRARIRHVPEPRFQQPVPGPAVAGTMPPGAASL